MRVVALALLASLSGCYLTRGYSEGDGMYYGFLIFVGLLLLGAVYEVVRWLRR